MATYALPSKEFTIGAIGTGDEVDELTLTVLGDSAALVAADVNRYLVTRSDGKKNHFRRILAIDVTNQVVTLDLPFSVRLFPDQATQDVVVGDTLALTHDFADVIADNDGVLLTNTNNVFLDSLILSGGAYVDANYYSITLESEYVKISRNSGFLLGVPVPNENPLLLPSIQEFCNVTDISEGTGDNNLAGGASKGADFGMLGKFGGSWISANKGEPIFYRTYDDPVESRVIFYRGAWGGGFSIRVDGHYCYTDMRAAGMLGTIGPFSARTSDFGVVRLGVTTSPQLYYAFATEGPEAVIGITSVTKMNTGSRVARFALSSSNLGFSRIEYVISKVNFDKPDNGIWITAANTSSLASAGEHVQRLCSNLNPTFVGADGIALTDTIYSVFKEASGKKIVEYDGTEDAFVEPIEITNGEFPVRRMRWADILTRTSGQSSNSYKTYTHADATRFQEVVGFTKGYGYLTVRSVIDPEKNFLSDVRVDVDPNIDETDQTVVDAYTEIDTAEKLYDSYSSWRCSVDNIEIEDELERVGGLIKTGDIDLKMATDYDATATYAVGAVVYADSKIYQCATAITQGQAFTVTNWTEKVDGVFGVELLANADTDISSTIDAFYFYYGTADFTGSVDLGAGTLTIEDLSAISGTIAEQSLVRVNMNLPANTTLKGKHEGEGAIFTDIDYEDLGDGTFKSILVAPDAEVKLAFCVRGSSPRYFLYDSANGITITPEFTAYTNPIGDDEDWIDDFTLSYGSGSLDAVCDDLSNITGNNISGSDMTLFLYKIHRSEAYLDLLLDKEADGFIVDTANSVFNVIEVDSFALDMELSLDDTLAENLEISFSYLYPTGSDITTPKNANAVASKVDLFKRNEVSTWDQDANQAQINAQTIALQAQHDVVKAVIDSNSDKLDDLKKRSKAQDSILSKIHTEIDEIILAVSESVSDTRIIEIGQSPYVSSIRGYQAGAYGALSYGSPDVDVFDIALEMNAFEFQSNDNVDNFGLVHTNTITDAQIEAIQNPGNFVRLTRFDGFTIVLNFSDTTHSNFEKSFVWTGVDQKFTQVPIIDDFENKVTIQVVNAQGNTVLSQAVANKAAIDNAKIVADDNKTAIDAVKVVVDSNDTKLDTNKTAIDGVQTTADNIDATVAPIGVLL